MRTSNGCTGSMPSRCSASSCTGPGTGRLPRTCSPDTFERVLRARRRFDPAPASEKTWLYAIALNCLRDRGAAAQRRAGRSSGSDSPGRRMSSLAVGLEDRDELNRALKVLSNEEREAIALRYGADLTVPEIAKLTGDRLTTVEGRVYRALGKLRDELS